MSRYAWLAMGTMVTSAVGLLGGSGCLQAETEFCNNGSLCPRGTVCSNVFEDTCVLPSQRDCGNGIVDEFEVCDDGGAQVGEDNTCDDTCRSDLTCGNGIKDEERGEECDCGPTPGPECKCSDDCALLCGNGVLDPGEVCDGSVLDNMACTGFGFDIGNLQCSADCQAYDKSDCARIGWYLDPMAPTSDPSPVLRAVHGIDVERPFGDIQPHVFAVGEAGAWWRLQSGSDWTDVSWCEPNEGERPDFVDVWVASPNEAYAVSDNGVIARYNGNGKCVAIEHRDPVRDGFVAVWAGDAGNPLVLNENGQLRQRNVIPDPNQPGSSEIVWELVPTENGLAHPVDMWVRDARNLFVVSESGDVHHYNDVVEVGTESIVRYVVSRTLDDTAHYRAVFGVGQELFAVGDGGAYRHGVPDPLDRDRWDPLERVPGEPDLRAVWGNALGDVLMVGHQGTAMVWQGRNVLQTRPLEDAGYRAQEFESVWQSSTGSVYAVDGLSPGIWRYHGSDWILHDPQAGAMRAVWGRPNGELHALADAGYHLHYNGTSWNGMAVTPDGAELNALFGHRDTGELFAVGDAGGAYEFTPAGWVPISDIVDVTPVPDMPDLLTVWVATDDDGDIFIGGTDGMSYRRHHGVWTFHAIPQGVRINAIAGNDHAVFAATEGGIFRFDAETLEWKNWYFQGSKPEFTGMSGAGDTIIAVGPSGAVVRMVADGDWKLESELPDGMVDLHSVWVVSSERAFVAGDSGTLWQFEHDVWSPINSYTSGEELTALWCEDDTVVVGRSDGKLGELTRQNK